MMIESNIYGSEISTVDLKNLILLQRFRSSLVGAGGIFCWSLSVSNQSIYSVTKRTNHRWR
jgi:hypothetical protein